jgi:hypothetical protein
MSDKPVSLDFTAAQPIALDFTAAQPIVQPKQSGDLSSIADVIEGIEALDLNSDTGEKVYDPSGTGVETTLRHELCTAIGFHRYEVHRLENEDILARLYQFAAGVRRGDDLEPRRWDFFEHSENEPEYQTYLARQKKTREIMAKELQPRPRYSLKDGWFIVRTEYGRAAFKRAYEIFHQLEEQGQ